MANEPGLHTSLTTDNRKYDQSMAKSIKATDLVTDNLQELGREAQKTGMKVSAAAGKMDQASAAHYRLAASLRNLENNYLNAGNASSVTAQRVTATGRAFRVMRGQLYNASIQAQDFAVQVAGGTSALTAFSQNAPQFLSTLGPWGAALGGLIAAFPLLAMALRGASGDIKNFDTELSKAAENIGKFESSLAQMSENFQSAFALIQREIKSTSAATAELARIAGVEAEQSLRKVAQALSDASTEAGFFDKFFLNTDATVTGDLLNINTALRGNITSWKEAHTEVDKFIDAVRGIATADSTEEMLKQAKLARSLFKKTVDVTKEMTDEQFTFWKDLNENIVELERMRAVKRARVDADMLARAKQMGDAELKIGENLQESLRAQALKKHEAEVQLAEKLQKRLQEQALKKHKAEQAAILQTENYIKKMAKVFRDAQKRMREEDLAETERSLDRVFRNRTLSYKIRFADDEAVMRQPVTPEGGKLDPGKSAEELLAMGLTPEDLKRMGIDLPKAAKGGVDPFVGQFEQLKNSLMTQEELEKASFDRRSELLRKFLTKNPEDVIKYHEMMERLESQHAERLKEIDIHKYGTSSEKAEAFFGDMADAFAQGNDKMFKISKKFGAAKALISAWEGAAEALKLPFPQNLAAFSAVLAQGLGAVSAIKSVNPGSTSAAGGGGGGAVAAAPQVSRNVAIQLQGDTFGRQQVMQLINQINEAVEDGAIVRLV